MITSMAFIAHPTRDMQAAKHFYGALLGLRPGVDYQGLWAEYSTPDGQAIAIDASAAKPIGKQSVFLALETNDIEGDVAHLRNAGVSVRMEIQSNRLDTGGEICKTAIVLDPDGNAIMLHQMASDRIGEDSGS